MFHVKHLGEGALQGSARRSRQRDAGISSLLVADDASQLPSARQGVRPPRTLHQSAHFCRASAAIELFGCRLALQGDEDAAPEEEWCGVLDQYRQRRDRPGRDHRELGRRAATAYSSARACTASIVGVPPAGSARRTASILRRAESSRTASRPDAMESGTPGNPPPLPTSQSLPGRGDETSGSAARLSTTCRRRAWSTSRIAVRLTEAFSARIRSRYSQLSWTASKGRSTASAARSRAAASAKAS